MSKKKLSRLKLQADNTKVEGYWASERTSKQATISHFFSNQRPKKRNVDEITAERESGIASKRQCEKPLCTKDSDHSVSEQISSKLQEFEKNAGAPSVKNVKNTQEKEKLPKECTMPHKTDASGTSSGSRQKATDKKDGKVKHTPLELQFIEIKEKNPNCLLFVECGYKYRFFGEDAEIAAKELNIFCHLDHNFMTASIPTHRLHIHVSKLVSKGYKVGVVKQMETAALKAAGDNRSAPFTRKLTNVYTIGTFIESNLECEDTEAVNTGGRLMCVYENIKTSTDKLQPMALLSVDLATGEVLYDSFVDGTGRFELESRMKHIQPIEVLLPQSVSAFTQNMLKTYNDNCCDSVARTELINDGLFSDKSSLDHVRRVYEKLGATGESIKEVLQLDRDVLVCLQAMLSYLEEFNLNKVLSLNAHLLKHNIIDRVVKIIVHFQSKFVIGSDVEEKDVYGGTFKPFSDKGTYMQLCGRTLDNLEVFVNSVDGKQHGSLYWLLNQTVTGFGGRLLKHWLGQPLMDLKTIKLRQDAIDEILGEPALEKLRLVLKGLPDLERGLTLIFHGKCSPQEFLLVCKSLLRVHSFIVSLNISVKSVFVQNILEELPKKLVRIEHWVKSLNPEAAKEGNKKELFTQESGYPAIREVNQQMADILTEIQNHRRQIRLTLKSPALEYTTVLGTEFLVEVKNTNLQLVPENWMKVSGTKAVTRYHTPFIVEAYKRLSQQRERLEAVCDEAWQQFLRSFEAEYAQYKEAVHYLATIDCLYALAQVAKEQGYCRPELTEDPGIIDIKQGRHPMVDILLSEESHQFVPNDTNMHPSGEQCMLITGPNMGGKSSYIKQVALICIMAQMGSFVPGESAHISLLDAVHTRMGASDELYKGRSTFMVELCEASEVMKKATRQSLVIMDELGRGTSTHDGVAIAYAALRHFVEKAKCLTMFVTHYPTLVEVEQMHPGIVANYHMSFYVQDSDDSDSDVENLVFLYQLVRGMAHRSYGLNVARLAGMPQTILKEASTRSKQMEEKVTRKRNADDLFSKVFKEGITDGVKNELLKYS